MTEQINSGTPPSAISTNGFFKNPDFDFVARSMIGYAAQGVMDIGQVFATIARVIDGNADSWHAAWRATAERLHGEAKASLAAGRERTAHRQFLGASEGYAQANAFADGQSDEATFAPTFALQSECWEAFVDSSAGRIVRIDTPYEGTTIPGFLFRPDASGARRPTLLMSNGSEGSKSGLWAWGVSETLARGWNAFIFDGPGQQTMLFDKNVPFRPDWEAVLTPIVDMLVARGDIDSCSLFAYGCSQSGYWLTRALAFEHRFVAAIVDPGVMDVSTKWLSSIPSQLAALLKAGNKEAFNAAIAQAAENPKFAELVAFRGRPFAQPTAYDTFAAAMTYNIRDVIELVKTPLLITDPEDETFWPGQSEELAAKLSGNHQLVKFARADGSNWHCEPMGRAAVENAMLDFLQEQLTKAD